MSRLNKKIILSVIVLSTNFAFFNPSDASWPVFSAPDEEYLLRNNYIETKHCPHGEGQVVNNAFIVVQTLCKTFCPTNWIWKLRDKDPNCLKLDKDFNFQGYEIKHYKGSDGTMSFSRITALYGSENKISFKIIFTSPKEHWFCIAQNKELHTFTCANDI